MACLEAGFLKGEKGIVAEDDTSSLLADHDHPRLPTLADPDREPGERAIYVRDLGRLVRELGNSEICEVNARHDEPKQN